MSNPFGLYTGASSVPSLPTAVHRRTTSRARSRDRSADADSAAAISSTPNHLQPTNRRQCGQPAISWTSRKGPPHERLRDSASSRSTRRHPVILACDEAHTSAWRSSPAGTQRAHRSSCRSPSMASWGGRQRLHFGDGLDRCRSKKALPSPRRWFMLPTLSDSPWRVSWAPSARPTATGGSDYIYTDPDAFAGIHGRGEPPPSAPPALPRLHRPAQADQRTGVDVGAYTGRLRYDTAHSRPTLKLGHRQDLHIYCERHGLSQSRRGGEAPPALLIQLPCIEQAIGVSLQQTISTSICTKMLCTWMLRRVSRGPRAYELRLS